MSKLILGLALAASLVTACDVSDATAVAPPTARSTGATGGTGATGTTGATGASGAATAAPVPTAAPATPAPTPVRTAPPPPPPPQTAASIKAIPARGVRGTNFVFQASGFPASRDIIQTVTLPTGAKAPSRTFTTNPDGTALTTYTPSVSDPSGQYVITLQIAGGGASAFVIIIVD